MICECSCHRLGPGEIEKHIAPCCEYTYMPLAEILKLKSQNDDIEGNY